MDSRLIDLYNDELLHLRTESAEFAREFPESAARLGIDDTRVEDPYVERLLEGVAFLAARVRLKLDSQYPVFTQQLLDVLFPGWLNPTPSACVLRMRPDTSLAELADGPVLPRGSRFRGSLRGTSEVRCDFQLARDLQLLPLELVSAQYAASRPPVLNGYSAADRPASSLRVELRATGGADFSTLPLDRLPLFVTMADANGSQFMELLGGRCLAVALSQEPSPRRPHAWLEGRGVRQIGFDDDEALLPAPVRGHTGFRVLKEYAAFPDKFRFVEVAGLKKALARFKGDKLYLHFYFSGAFSRLESAVGAQSLALFCAPAVNLRERQLDRVDIVPGLTEYHLVGDRMRPREHEIIQVLDVHGGGASSERPFTPIYEAVATTGPAPRSFYVLRRERRPVGQAEARRGPVTYQGCETYVSISEPGTPPFGRDLQYLTVRALCSNRDMPLYLAAQFADARYEPQDSIPVQHVDCVAGPSAPVSSPVDGFDPWVALSHLFVNYLSLMGRDGSQGADVLRAMLALYATAPGHFLHRQSQGLTAVRAEQVTRRIPGGGPLAFGRGIAVTLGMSDASFDGGSPYLLAAVMENYLAAHVSINSFVETHLALDDRAEHIAWPTRFGRRPTF